MDARSGRVLLIPKQLQGVLRREGRFLLALNKQIHLSDADVAPFAHSGFVGKHNDEVSMILRVRNFEASPALELLACRSKNLLIPRLVLQVNGLADWIGDGTGSLALAVLDSARVRIAA
jgi:hypothetical protein